MDQVDLYREAHEMQKKDLQYMLNEFSEEIAEMDGRCADLGCGIGLSSEMLLAMLPARSSVVGVDISPGMIEYAQRQYAHEKRLSFIELDIATKTLPPEHLGAFDNVVSTMCIHWCHDYRQVFENIYKLLRPGGKALVLFLAKHPLFPVYPVLHNIGGGEFQTYMTDFLRFIPFLQNEEYPGTRTKKILRENKFEVLHCSHRDRTYIFENWEEIEKYATAVNPFRTRMPEDVKKKYDEALGHALRKTEHALIYEPDRVANGTQGRRILSAYRLLIAYFKKPTITGSNCCNSCNIQ